MVVIKLQVRVLHDVKQISVKQYAMLADKIQMEEDSGTAVRRKTAIRATRGFIGHHGKFCLLQPD